MRARAFDVQWELAADEGFTRIRRRGTVTATTELAHSMHVDLAGLRPGSEYYFRLRVAGHLSPTGRTRTAPASGCSTRR